MDKKPTGQGQHCVFHLGCEFMFKIKIHLEILKDQAMGVHLASL